MTRLVLEVSNDGSCSAKCAHCSHGKQEQGGIMTSLQPNIKQTYASLQQIEWEDISLHVFNTVNFSGFLPLFSGPLHHIRYYAGTIDELLTQPADPIIRQYSQCIEALSAPDQGAGGVTIAFRQLSSLSPETTEQLTRKVSDIIQRLIDLTQNHNKPLSLSLGLRNNAIPNRHFGDIVGTSQTLFQSIEQNLHQNGMEVISSEDVLENTYIQRLQTEGKNGSIIEFNSRYIHPLNSRTREKLNTELLKKLGEIGVMLLPDEVRIIHGAWNIDNPLFSFTHKDFRAILDMIIQENFDPEIALKFMVKERMSILQTSS